METKKDTIIQLKGTNEAYLLHFPQTATEFPMPLYDKIIVQLLDDIEFWQKSFDERTKDFKNSEDKISHLESTLKEADALIEVQAKSLRTYGRHILIENQHDSYNQLKSNQQSPNS